MFVDSVSEMVKIVGKVGTAILVMPESEPLEIRNALVLQPEDKATITIEQVREVLALLMTRQTEDRFVIIRPADKLGEEAENAILKNLEEPGERVHFVLVTDNLSKLLPTIRSRAAIYVLRRRAAEAEIEADEKVKMMAKRLLTAKPAEMVALADELTKKKDGVRGYVLTVLGVAIEMAYKSYFLTGKAAFLQKLPKLLTAYDGIEKNGQIKLQIVANVV